MRRVAATQPTYLPWLGYFDLIRRADEFIVYDHVQFSRQSWQQRNRIRDRRGEILLTVPVLHGDKGPQPVHEVKIDGSKNFAEKHLKSIHANYARAPHFERFFPELESILRRGQERLADLNLDIIRWGMKTFRIETPMRRSRDMRLTGDKVTMLVEACQQVGADHYYSPVGSKDYIEESDAFQRAGIFVEFQQFEHPTYRQLNHPDFISHLSFIDYLFNAGDRWPHGD